jgi:hypothetical protein
MAVVLRGGARRPPQTTFKYPPAKLNGAVGGLLAVALALWAGEVAAQEAHPQFHGAALVGVARGTTSEQRASSTQLQLGLRADGVWGRRSSSSVGVGVVTDVRTRRFADVQFAAGPTLVLPVTDPFPLVLSVGPFVHRDESTRMGGFVSLALGPRTYNFHGNYSLAGGLLLDARKVPGGGPTTISANLEVDLQIVVLPFLLLVNAFR